jgi:hypothetical protein
LWRVLVVLSKSVEISLVAMSLCQHERLLILQRSADAPL